LRFGTWNLEFETWNLEFETWNLEFETWNLEFETWNLEFETWNLEFGTWVFRIWVSFSTLLAKFQNRYPFRVREAHPIHESIPLPAQGSPIDSRIDTTSGAGKPCRPCGRYHLPVPDGCMLLLGVHCLLLGY